MDITQAQVVIDPETALEDALNFTPWTGDSTGKLPQRGEWSTFRYAAKDIVFGAATFQFDTRSRCLVIRSYFTGEHPIYEPLEPTRAMVVIFLCQAWQAGRSQELVFEGGIPFDVRELMQVHLSSAPNGHEERISHELGEQLFAALSGFDKSEKEALQNENVSIADVCFSSYRGVWSVKHVRAMIHHKVPLNGIFGQPPGVVTSPSKYWAMHQALRAILLEDYVIKRLEHRELGETMGNKIEELSPRVWAAKSAININQEDGNVVLNAGETFQIHPLVLTGGARELLKFLDERDLTGTVRVIGIPMDAMFDDSKLWKVCVGKFEAKSLSWVAVSLSRSHLTSEILLKLSQSRSASDIDFNDLQNADRHTD